MLKNLSPKDRNRVIDLIMAIRSDIQYSIPKSRKGGKMRKVGIVEGFV